MAHDIQHCTHRPLTARNTPILPPIEGEVFVLREVEAALGVLFRDSIVLIRHGSAVRLQQIENELPTLQTGLIFMALVRLAMSQRIDIYIDGQGKHDHQVWICQMEGWA